MPDEAFILGSGASIQNLTQEEKEYLNKHPYTLGMNKYLVFHDLLGVIPQDMFLIDRGKDAHIVFSDTMRIFREKKLQGRFFVHEYYLSRYYRYTSLTNLVFTLAWRLRFLWKHHLWLDLKRGPLQPLQLKVVRDIAQCASYWAKDLTDPLLTYYRASLTAAINLVSILYPIKKIKLLGVDLNSSGSFYSHVIDNYFGRRRFIPIEKPYYADAQKANLHPTAIINHHGDPGITAAIPYIHKHLAAQGQTLINCNPDSLLVKENIVQYESVIS